MFRSKKPVEKSVASEEDIAAKYGENYPNEAQREILRDLVSVYQEFGVDNLADLIQICPDGIRLSEFFDKRLIEAREIKA